MKIKKTEIPLKSLTREYLPADYTDTFLITTDHEIQSSPDDIMVSFWTDMPGWVNALFKLRNFLVQFVGLKGDEEGSTSELEAFIRTGGEYRFMKIPARDRYETVLLMSDKHLDAHLSVRKENNYSVSVNTLVHFHNTLGRVYFFVIKPFHGIIVRQLLKRTIKKHTSKYIAL